MSKMLNKNNNNVFIIIILNNVRYLLYLKPVQ